MKFEKIILSFLLVTILFLPVQIRKADEIDRIGLNVFESLDGKSWERVDSWKSLNNIGKENFQVITSDFRSPTFLMWFDIQEDGLYLGKFFEGDYSIERHPYASSSNIFSIKDDNKNGVHIWWKKGDSLEYTHYDGHSWSIPITFLHSFQGNFFDIEIINDNEVYLIHESSLWVGNINGTGIAKTLPFNNSNNLFLRKDHIIDIFNFNINQTLTFQHSENDGDSWSSPIIAVENPATDGNLLGVTSDPEIILDEIGVYHLTVRYKISSANESRDTLFYTKGNESGWFTPALLINGSEARTENAGIHINDNNKVFSFWINLTNSLTNINEFIINDDMEIEYETKINTIKGSYQSDFHIIETKENSLQIFYTNDFRDFDIFQGESFEYLLIGISGGLIIGILIYLTKFRKK